MDSGSGASLDAPPAPSPVRASSGISTMWPGRGRGLFAAVCAHDLASIVAKEHRGLYAPGGSEWVNVKNRDYSQARDRWKLFERRTP